MGMEKSWLWLVSWWCPNLKFSVKLVDLCKHGLEGLLFGVACTSVLFFIGFLWISLEKGKPKLLLAALAAIGFGWITAHVLWLLIET